MKPYLFDEFFSSGLEESISPFLTKKSRTWGKNLSLKSSSSAAVLLLFAFLLSFVNLPSSHLLLSLVYFLVGTPALISALHDLKNLEINIDILMTTAAFVAILLGSGLEGALLLVLFALSHSLEDLVTHKAKSAIHNLNHIAPKFAYVLAPDKTLFEKSVKEITPGTHLFIKTGEIVPLDGTIIEGSSSVNLVHLTGESLPLPKTIGDTLPAGARNLEAALVIEVTRTNSDSTLTRIIQLVTAAAHAKPRMQRLLDRFGGPYATTIISLTLLFALALPLFFPLPYLGTEGAIYRALAFLIAASPCALILATPTAYLSALSACARQGILLKGGVTLDALATCKTIAFDKTGTLTTGDLLCTSFEPLTPSPLSPDEVLSIAYGLERQVVHPIATAICRLAEEKKLTPAAITSFQSHPGSHLEGRYGALPVAIGLPEKIAPDLPPSTTDHILAALRIGPHLYLFRFTDQIRKDLPPLMQKLTHLKLTPIMLTGDHAANAHAVGKTLGLSHIFADLRPEDKLTRVAALSSQHGLAMVGDGINDAPALARATVGISMGRIGSAAAVDASDAILLKDDLHLLPFLFHKARQTIRISKQNITLSLAVIILASTPALLGLVPLWAAVLLHEGGTLLVGLNSLRLLRTPY